MADGLIIDNFAGGGGASYGMELALGRPVDVAVNHSPEAIAVHRANHPKTRHFLEDVWAVDPREATGDDDVALAWFSPDCKHFSKAKGSKPVDRNVRGLAWVVVKWAREVRPTVIMLENVEEFESWGPLDADDMPSKAHKGDEFRFWKGQLEALGYAVEHRTLRASDYGAPTIRKRLFLVARCDGRPIVWPAPSHGEGLLPFRTAASIIEWWRTCPSIFERKRPLVENTMRRIAAGMKRYVLEAADPFIVTYYGPKAGEEFRGQGLGEPLATQTTENRHGLVYPYVTYANHGGDHFRGQRVDKALSTVTGSREKLLVAARAAPVDDRSGQVAAFMAKHYGGMVGVDLRTPAPTQTVTGSQNQLVVGHLEVMRNHGSGQSVEAPIPTLTAGGCHIAEVRAFLTKYYSSGPQAGQSLAEGLHTATERARFGLVTVAGLDYQIYDIGMRMLSPRELFRAQGFPDDYVIDPEFNGKALTKTAQIRLCGNSVCPVIPEAMVRANLPELCVVEGVA